MDGALKKMIEYAYHKSPFYMELSHEEKFADGMESLPIIHKEQIVKAKTPLLPYSYYGLLASGKMIRESTSGSTGECLEILWREGDFTASQMPLWKYRRKFYGIHPADKLCYFYTLRQCGKDELESERYRNGLGFSKTNLTSDRIEEIYQKMLDFQPKWILSQPSIMFLLARHVFESGAEEIASLQYIELSGEMLSDHERNFISRAFGCTVANQYGCNEIGTIAYECPKGKMHIMEDNVFVEICKEGHRVSEYEEGDIVVTSKWNYAMPLIRYAVGDTGSLADNDCTCGMHGRILSSLRGRKNDFIQCRNGEVLPAYEFIRTFHCINEEIDGNVYQFQVQQLAYDEFEVKVVTDVSDEKLIRCFYECISNPILAEAKYTFEFRRELLPENTTGKHRFFRCKMTDG